MGQGQKCLTKQGATAQKEPIDLSETASKFAKAFHIDKPIVLSKDLQKDLRQIPEKLRASETEHSRLLRVLSEIGLEIWDRTRQHQEIPKKFEIGVTLGVREGETYPCYPICVQSEEGKYLVSPTRNRIKRPL